MHSNRFWELWAKQLSGEITPEELKELTYLKGEDEFLPYDYSLMQAVSSLTFHSDEISGMQLPEKWAILQSKIIGSDTTPVPVRKTPVLKRLLPFTAAASLALPLFLGWHWWWKQAPNTITGKPNIFSTRNGSRSKLQMPDGTQVWLNGGSSLQYDNNTYGENQREVALIGEAYFDVVKDVAHPFVIHTKAMNIRVVGTAFNVRAYPNEKHTETALIRGVIEVSFPGRPAEKLLLKPNEKLTVANPVLPQENKGPGNQSAPPAADSNEPLIVLSTIAYEPTDSTVAETAWIRNRLVFRSKTFAELTQDMERWYGVVFRFKDSSLMSRRLTGTFQNETIFEALDYLKMSSPFQYRFDKHTNTIFLSR